MNRCARLNGNPPQISSKPAYTPGHNYPENNTRLTAMALEAKEPAGMGVQDQAPESLKLSRYRSVRRTASQKENASKSAIPAVPVPPIPTEPVSQKGAGPANQQGPPIARSVSRYRRQRNQVASDTAQPSVSARLNMPGTPREKTREMKTSATEGRSGRTEEEEEFMRAKHREDAMRSLTGGDSGVASKQTQRLRSRSLRHRQVEAKDTPKVEPKRPMKRSDKDAKNGQTDDNGAKHRRWKNPMNLSRPNEEAPLNPSGAGGGVTAHIDAPVSAPNAGERSVQVKYRQSSTYLPVTPSTKVHDILHLAQSFFSNEIDAQKFIVIESFTPLELERPLRKYEYVRDIMNSWGHDEQNVLIIIPAASADTLHKLEARSAPIEQPIDTTFHIYHSQRSRKWDKRYVSLRADGQVTLSKKPQAREQTNICHLSDFDVYSPTASSLSNDGKPPKKICYAVKSQQKASIFLTTDNYAHFFSTNDKEVAEGWYKAIQAWRSWYLVHVLRAGQSKEEEASQSGASRKGSIASSSSRNQPQPLKPLLDFNPIGYEDNDAEKPLPSSLRRSKSSKTKQSVTHKENTKLLTVDTSIAGPKVEGSLESPFSPTGLLGQGYTMRQLAMQEQEKNDKRAREEAFLPQGLVSVTGARHQGAGRQSQPGSRSNTMTETRDPDIQRSQSLHKSKQKPLVVLTPRYPELPQCARKGKGVAVEPGMPLVDAATGPEIGPNAIAVPSAANWKRPPIPEEPVQQGPSTTNGQAISRSNTTRSARYHRSNRAAPVSPVSPVKQRTSSEMPFASHGFLAQSVNSNTVQGGRPTGHGLATGDRNATKPMLDLSPENPFVEGSLLRDL